MSFFSLLSTLAFVFIAVGMAVSKGGGRKKSKKAAPEKKAKKKTPKKPLKKTPKEKPIKKKATTRKTPKRPSPKKKVKKKKSRGASLKEGVEVDERKYYSEFEVIKEMLSRDYGFKISLPRYLEPSLLPYFAGNIFLEDAVSALIMQTYRKKDDSELTIRQAKAILASVKVAVAHGYYDGEDMDKIKFLQEWALSNPNELSGEFRDRIATLLVKRGKPRKEAQEHLSSIREEMLGLPDEGVEVRFWQPSERRIKRVLDIFAENIYDVLHLPYTEALGSPIYKPIQTFVESLGARPRPELFRTKTRDQIKEHVGLWPATNCPRQDQEEELLLEQAAADIISMAPINSDIDNFRARAILVCAKYVATTSYNFCDDPLRPYQIVGLFNWLMSDGNPDDFKSAKEAIIDERREVDSYYNQWVDQLLTEARHEVTYGAWATPFMRVSEEYRPVIESILREADTYLKDDQSNPLNPDNRKEVADRTVCGISPDLNQIFVRLGNEIYALTRRGEVRLLPQRMRVPADFTDVMDVELMVTRQRRIRELSWSNPVGLTVERDHTLVLWHLQRLTPEEKLEEFVFGAITNFVPELFEENLYIRYRSPAIGYNVRYACMDREGNLRIITKEQFRLFPIRLREELITDLEGKPVRNIPDSNQRVFAMEYDGKQPILGESVENITARARQEILDLPLGELSRAGGLPLRTINALGENGIYTVKKLCETSIEVVEKIPNFGPENLKKIREILGQFKLYMKDDPANPEKENASNSLDFFLLFIIYNVIASLTLCCMVGMAKVKQKKAETKEEKSDIHLRRARVFRSVQELIANDEQSLGYVTTPVVAQEFAKEVSHTTIQRDLRHLTMLNLLSGHEIGRSGMRLFSLGEVSGRFKIPGPELPAAYLRRVDQNSKYIKRLFATAIDDKPKDVKVGDLRRQYRKLLRDNPQNALEFTRRAARFLDYHGGHQAYARMAGRHLFSEPVPRKLLFQDYDQEGIEPGVAQELLYSGEEDYRTEGEREEFYADDDDKYYAKKIIGDTPLLTTLGEVILGVRARCGDIAARNEMWQSNIRLIANIARFYCRRSSHFTFLDFIDTGSFGLERAINKFDPHLGFRFSTHGTYWIRRQIARDIATKEDIVRKPLKVQEKDRELLRLCHEAGIDPRMDWVSPAVIADAIGISDEEADEFQERRKRPLSLDKAFGQRDEDRHDATLKNAIAVIPQVLDADTFRTIVEEIVKKTEDALRRGWQTGRGKRTPIERIMKIWNLGARAILLSEVVLIDEPKTLTEIGREMGFTKSAASQIEIKIRKIMREQALEVLSNVISLDFEIDDSFLSLPLGRRQRGRKIPKRLK